jgi:hypothetical protein
MNYDELKGYLINASDATFVELIDSINDVFTKYSVPDYLEEINNIILSNSDKTDQEIVDTIRTTLDSIIEWLLKLNNIELVDDCLISDKLVILEGMIDIQSYLDKVVIDNILNTEQTNEEKISELLTLVTSFNIEKNLSLIKNVDDVTIKMILDFNSGFLTSKIETFETVKKQIDRYNKYKTFINNIEIYSDKYLSNSETIALPFEVYFTTYLTELKEINIDSVVYDLIGMIMISDNDQAPIEVIRKCMGKITNDANLSTKIDMQALKIITELR